MLSVASKTRPKLSLTTTGSTKSSEGPKRTAELFARSPGGPARGTRRAFGIQSRCRVLSDTKATNDLADVVDVCVVGDEPEIVVAAILDIDAVKRSIALALALAPPPQHDERRIEIGIAFGIARRIGEDAPGGGGGANAEIDPHRVADEVPAHARVDDEIAEGRGRGPWCADRPARRCRCSTPPPGWWRGRQDLRSVRSRGTAFRR